MINAQIVIAINIDNLIIINAFVKMDIMKIIKFVLNVIHLGLFIYFIYKQSANCNGGSNSECISCNSNA